MRLSLKTLANALDLPLSTVERWVRQGRIPIQRIGYDAIFSRSTLQRWAASHQLPFDLDNAPVDSTSEEAFDSLVSVMRRGKVFHGVKGADKESSLRSAVACVDFLSSEIQDELYEKLSEREQLASTGIGNGIAIPHPRDPLARAPESPVITTCFLETPVPYNAIDDQPVSILFLLISPTVKHHLHMLSRLSYCIRDRSFVGFLHKHPAADDLFSNVETFEKKLDEH